MFKMPSGIGRLVYSVIPEGAYDESTDSICRKGTYQVRIESCRARALQSEVAVMQLRMPERHLG